MIVKRSWQHWMRTAVRDPQELCQRLGLEDIWVKRAEAGQQAFPVFVPEPFLSRMQPGCVDDPLLRQVLPLIQEGQERAGYVSDPLNEASFEAAPGMLQKYEGRALLVVGGACAVHCRYCFRRHFPYGELPRGKAWWDEAVARVQADTSIEELLLSGGDPLVQPTAVLSALVDDFLAISHLQRMRIHTRLPVVIPDRVDEDFLAFCEGVQARGRSLVVVMHANHAAELDDAVARAVADLRSVGVMVLNQAVLLAGVNDSVEVQVGLAKRLIRIGVMPYYLHVLDPVAGAWHFDMPTSRAVDIHKQMAAQLSGYMVPRLVREVPGGTGKMPVY